MPFPRLGNYSKRFEFENHTDAANLLGHSASWFHRNVSNLEDMSGFPKVDIATRMYNRLELIEWAGGRNVRAAGGPIEGAASKRNEDDDAF